MLTCDIIDVFGHIELECLGKFLSSNDMKKHDEMTYATTVYNIQGTGSTIRELAM